MLHKESGKRLGLALRPSSTNRRHASTPKALTYSKAVRFDSNLEQGHFFRKVDMPLAVGVGSPHASQYKSKRDGHHHSRYRQFKWGIRLDNFPVDTPERKLSSVYLECMALSSDNENLIGVILVANLAFTKQVVARFTCEFWETMYEVVAEYRNDLQHNYDGERDRFSFNISLMDLEHLENKTISVGCVHDNVRRNRAQQPGRESEHQRQ